MIIQLDNRNNEIAEEIVKLQKASYIVEAELIDFMQIPPLMESPEDIINSQELYYGYYFEGRLAGIISYTIENDTLDICKVAVHPEYFKRGVAKQLLRLVEDKGAKKLTVSTGAKNSPAVKLYTSLGFTKTYECEVVKGLFISHFEKQL